MIDTVHAEVHVPSAWPGAGAFMDVPKLSPLEDRHINFRGRYLFTIKACGLGRGLHPSGTPDAAEH
ncbi:hypothetical protein [Streptomyces sp. NPDC053079]|uniref:hypothetical protein n=1 Tax=Streptomyces sp. NPDC053079 TaxID=3365697 RepID=UPI0037CD9F70